MYQLLGIGSGKNLPFLGNRHRQELSSILGIGTGKKQSIPINKKTQRNFEKHLNIMNYVATNNAKWKAIDAVLHHHFMPD